MADDACYLMATNGAFIAVDDDVYKWAKWFRWRMVNGYATHGRRGLHRIVMDAPDGVLVDHQNGNTLDNRRANLRLATFQENSRNRAPDKRPQTSRFKGVHLRGDGACRRKRWRARIRDGQNKTPIHLGYFDTEEEAAAAYDKAAKELHGEFARLNSR